MDCCYIVSIVADGLGTPSSSYTKSFRVIFVVVAAAAAAAADDNTNDYDDDYADEYDFTNNTQCLSFCCISKSIFALSAGTIDVSNSNILTVSQNSTAEAIHGILPLHIPVSLMIIYMMMAKKKKIGI